ncbi:MAG: pilus assembly protein [Planctomycetia bacterium]|nr:pilus assembly protein [Planctomycetia bacterium]
MSFHNERHAPSAGKLCRTHRSCGKFRRAAAVVEFAAVAPVLILLVFGMIEFGRMVMVQQVITNASREGARAGILDGATNASVTSTVNNYLASASISGATVTVTPTEPSTAPAGGSVTVAVSVPFSQVTWLPAPMFLGGSTLVASTVMRRETVQ